MTPGRHGTTPLSSPDHFTIASFVAIVFFVQYENDDLRRARSTAFITATAALNGDCSKCSSGARALTPRENIAACDTCGGVDEYAVVESASTC